MISRTIRKPRLAFAMMLLCLPAVTRVIAGPLPEFSADYRALRNGVTIGESTVSLSAVPVSGFLYESVTRAAGIFAWLHRARIREYSHWFLVDGKLRPLEYGYEKTGRDADRSEQVIFDWDRKRARQTRRQPVWEIDVPPETLDKALMQLALMLDLQRGKDDVTYIIPDDAKLRSYRFHVIAQQTIHTPAGRFETVKLERIRDNKRRSTLIWCAPELSYLPVQIDQVEDNGTVYRTELKRFSENLKRSSTRQEK